MNMLRVLNYAGDGYMYINKSTVVAIMETHNDKAKTLIITIPDPDGFVSSSPIAEVLKEIPLNGLRSDCPPAPLKEVK